MSEYVPLPADTRMGPVHYNVADLDRQIMFYKDILGFTLRSRAGETASLGTETDELLRLTEVPDARRRPGTTGLYHTAFLVPQRRDLAHLVRRLIVTRTPVQGTSNHGTHLAIYLPDPEGNGIELAWDFPRENWPMVDGEFDMSAAPRSGVDVEQLLGELDGDPTPWPGLPSGTTVGHIHLHVASLTVSRQFYRDVLGFDVIMHNETMGALFVSAGGYHHHIGMNVWRGVGLPPPEPTDVGLRHYTIVLPDDEERERVVGRLTEQMTGQNGGSPQGADASVEGRVTETEAGTFVHDPSGLRFLLTVE